MFSPAVIIEKRDEQDPDAQRSLYRNNRPANVGVVDSHQWNFLEHSEEPFNKIRLTIEELNIENQKKKCIVA